MKIKIISLSLILILTISISVLGADEIEHQEIITSNYFEYSLVGSSRVSNPVTQAVENNFGFTSMSQINVGRGSYRFYWYFDIPNLSQYNSNKYMLLEVANGFKTNLLNNNSTYLVTYDSNGTVINSILMDNRGTSIVNITINGVDFSFYQNYILMDYSEIEDFTTNVKKVAILQYFDSQDSLSVPTLVTDLKLSFYSNINDVVVDLNNKVEDLINQNQTIIQNQEQINGQLDVLNDKLDQFLEYDMPPEVDESLSNKFDDVNSEINAQESKNNSMENQANSMMNTSIPIDTSTFIENLDDFINNSDVQNFLGGLYNNPFLITCMTMLPLFWMVYLVLYRG